MNIFPSLLSRLYRLAAGNSRATQARRRIQTRRIQLGLESLERRELFAIGDPALAFGDFNGDDFQDLAVQGNEEVIVTYGTNRGLDGRSEQWYQGRRDFRGNIIEGARSSTDLFGDTLAVGDFNGDGVDDLAVGVPGENITGIAEAGAVNLIYGELGIGLTGRGNRMWHQDSGAVADQAEPHDWFGRELAVGDFDGNGVDDLAIGVPNEDLSKTLSNAGALHILFGRLGQRLGDAGNSFLHRPRTSADTSGGLYYIGASTLFARGERLGLDLYGSTVVLTPGDEFGGELVVGDFNGDLIDDLVVSTCHASVNGVYAAGAVQVIYGRREATAWRNEVWTQNSEGVADLAEQDDRFGRAVAVGDFDGNGASDLAIGVAGEDIAAAANAGAVHVIYAQKLTGLVAGNKSQFWHQESLGEQSERGDQFGRTLAAGDFDHNGRADLAIGTSESYEFARIYSAGSLHVLYGSQTMGLSVTGRDLFNSTDFSRNLVAIDSFGLDLVVADHNGDGYDDLAVGANYTAPSDPLTGRNAHILYGSTFGLVTSEDDSGFQLVLLLWDYSIGLNYNEPTLDTGLARYR